MDKLIPVAVINELSDAERILFTPFPQVKFTPTVGDSFFVDEALKP